MSLTLLLALGLAQAGTPRALLIGVGDYSYDDKEEAGWSNLASANDLELLKAGLQERGVAADDIALLEDKKATRQGVLDAIDALTKRTKAGDHVYVQAGASFLKLSKRTGETVWRTLVDQGGTFGSAFSSPVFATIKGKRQLLVQTRANLAGVDEHAPLR